MKIIWKKWCKKVDKHNEKLGYIWQEEAWSYFTIFLPFIFAMLIVILVGLITIPFNIPFDIFFKNAIKGAIGMFFLTSIFLFFNWKAYS